MFSRIAHAVAPAGTLRAVINVGNPVLASCNQSEDGPTGVSVDLANYIAREIGVTLKCTVVNSAGESVRLVSQGIADIGFFALDPERADQIRFASPYVLIEGCYLVRNASPLRRREEVDCSGNRVVVGKGSAYDLFLSRELRHAVVERAETSPLVVERFLETHADVAAGVRQQLEADAAKGRGLRLLEGSFMTIQQAVGIPRDRGDDALHAVKGAIRAAIKDGFVAEALARHNIDGARVAPIED